MKKVLVTGGTGFLGLQIIMQLLNQGYDVKTTIRKDSGRQRIIEVLENNGVKNINNLSFVKADLSSDENWNEAMRDRDGVFSVASPVFFGKIENESQAISPALNGIIRVLKAANDNDVKRVVMTANFGGVGFSKFSGVTTEKDWTDENQAGLSIYEKSKLLAEKAAWNYVLEPKVKLELVTVNPVAIFGPSLDAHVSGSFNLLKNLLGGKNAWLPDLPLNVVDVRDVASMQIKAMETPAAAGQRFIASADGQISMQEMGDLIRQTRPQLSDKVSSRRLPNWIINLAAPFNKTAREGQLMLRVNRKVSNQKAKDILNWQPQSSNSQAVLSAVDSLIKYSEV